MKLFEFYRDFIGLVLVVLLSGCGGSSDGENTSKAENTSIVSSNVILLDKTSSKKIIDSNVSDKTRLKISKDATADIEVGKVFFLPPGSDDRFPLGISGKIESVDSNSQDSSTITLSEVNLMDIVEESSLKESTVELNSGNFVGVIAPSSVTPSSRAFTQKKNNRKAGVKEKSFLNGGVVFISSGNKNKRDSFLGGDGSIDLGNISLNLEVKLKDMISDPSRLTAIDGTKEGKLVISGSLNNLQIKESHDISSFKQSMAFNTQLTGTFDTEAKLEGSHKIVLGSYDKAWKEVEKSSIDILGVKLTLTGLKSEDKIGKYPIVGLVFTNPTPIYTKTAKSALTSAKAGGLIVWVYMDAKGELTVDGSVGVGTHSKFTLGIDKNHNKGLQVIKNIEKSENGRLLEAPFLDGTVSLKANLGVSLEFDTIILGTRVASASINTGVEGTYAVGTEKRWSYGFDEIGQPWSWNHDELGCSLDFGAGVKVNADMNPGFEISAGDFKGDVNLNYSFEYPKKSTIDNVPSGWVGTWYKSEIINECGLNNLLREKTEYLFNHRIPVTENELKNLANEYYDESYLASRIYNESYADIGTTKDGWELVDLVYEKNGFMAGLYKKEGLEEYAIVFGGTSAILDDLPIMYNIGDIAIDFYTDLNLFSNYPLKTNQAKSAIDFLNTSFVKLVVDNNKVSFIVGHSLGGGLAQYIGAYTGINTVTFNTAPMAFDYNAIDLFLEKYNNSTGKYALEILRNEEGVATNFIFTNSEKITNIMSKYDPVSLLSESIESFDEENSILDKAYINTIKLFTFNSFDMNLDYLITGKTVYLPIHGVNVAASHSMDLIQESFSQLKDISGDNIPPTANAGVDQSVTFGSTVTLTGTGTDSDGTIVKYEWKEGDTLLAETEILTKSDFTVGSHALTFTVTDDKGATTMDNVIVTVSAITTSKLDNKMMISEYTDGETKDRGILAFYADKSCKLTIVTLNTEVYPEDPRLFTQDCQWSAMQTSLQLKLADEDENITVPLENGLITQNQMDENETLIGLYDIEQVNISDIENRYFEFYRELGENEELTTIKFLPDNVFTTYTDGTLDGQMSWSIEGDTLIISNQGMEMSSIQGQDGIFKMGDATTINISNGEKDNIVITKIGVIEEEIISTSKVLKTGQTTSYTDFDDGYYEIGVERSYTRVNDIVADNVTGLQWQDDEAAKTVTKPWVTPANYDARNYDDTLGDTATTYCSNLVLEGYSDWRLPTRVELRSIGCYDPTIDTATFQNITLNAYWSSTSFLQNENNQAWYVGMKNGFQGYSRSLGINKSTNRHVRCVRAGQ